MKAALTTGFSAALILLSVCQSHSEPKPDADISAMLGSFSESAMRDTVRDLEAFRSRTVGQPGNPQAAKYLHGRLARIPELQVAPLRGPWNNVVATLPGTDSKSQEVYIVGAHYDSIAETPETAPGATDNATGVSIVLEMARILGLRKFRHTIVFACWNGEEIGIKGSRDFVSQWVKDGRGVALYLNYDSTAFDPQGRLILDVIANPPAAAAKRLLIENNRLYGIGFTIVEDRHKCGSDHVPFAAAGFPAINTHQEEHGAHYHTAKDRIDLVSFPYAMKNGQLGLSVIAGLAVPDDTVIPTPNP
jgi:hypothetical protein